MAAGLGGRAPDAATNDAGVAVDASTPAVQRGVEPGCGCRAGAPGASLPSLLGALAVAVGLRRRRPGRAANDRR